MPRATPAEGLVSWIAVRGAAVGLAVGLVACVEDGGDAGLGSTPRWYASTAQGDAVFVEAADGLRAGPGSGALTDLPTETHGGQSIDIRGDGALTYTPNNDFWGVDTFDYVRGGRLYEASIAVLPGGPTLQWESTEHRAAILAYQSGAALGQTVINAGDLDGDGDDDLLATAPNAEREFGPQFNDGAVVVIPGRGDGSFSTGGNWLFGDAPEQALGTNACAAGDTNGDGLHDFYVTSRSGALFRVLGRENLTRFHTAKVSEFVDLTVTELWADSMLMRCDMDVIGDATPDVVIRDWARIYVVDGALTGDHGFDALEGRGDAVRINAYELFPDGVWLDDVAPYIDDDGVTRLAFQASTDDQRGVFGELDLRSATAEAWFETNSPARRVVVGRFGQADGLGVAYVGSSGFEIRYASQAWQTVHTLDLNPFDDFPEHLSAADYDGDGVDDLAIGYDFLTAPTTAAGQNGAGLVVAFGGATMSDLTYADVSAARGGFVLVNEPRFAGFGRREPAMGDFDGDGIDDYALGSPEQPSPDELDGSARGGVVLIKGFGAPADG